MSDFIAFDTDTLSLAAAAPIAAAAPAVEIYDPPLCCPTGLCGPTVDQTLLDVSDMIGALQSEGYQVERYQAASHPRQFTGNPAILRLIREKHMAALPITVVRSQIIKVGAYPTLAEIRSYLDEAGGL